MSDPDEYRFEGAAETLYEAEQAFDWRSQSRPSETFLARRYQERSTFRRLRLLTGSVARAAPRDGHYLHALYVGPPGCGKSTDLAWLVHQLAELNAARERLLVAHYGIAGVVGKHDVGFAEVALSLVLEAYAALERHEITFVHGGPLQRINTWLYGEEEVTRRTKGGAEVGLTATLLNMLRLRLFGSTTREHRVRTKVQHRLPEVLEEVAGLLERVREVTGKSMLFVVDDLEKLTPLDTALGLFLDHGGYFADLPCHLILTAPGALRLDPRYEPDVLHYFREFRALLGRPERDERELAEFDVLRRVVYRRMVPALIEPAAVDLAIRQTGGVIAQLVDVLQRAILATSIDEEPRVGCPQVEEALKEVSGRYDSVLEDRHFVSLGRLATTGLRSDLSDRQLLHNLAVLEYPDSPSEFAVHPLVVPLLDRWLRLRDHSGA